MTVGGDDDVLAPTRHLPHHPVDECPVVGRCGVAHSIRDVDRGRPCLHGSPTDRHHEVGIGPGGVLGGVLDVLGVIPGPGHVGPHRLQHLILTHPQLVLHVDARCCQEDVDAGKCCLPDRLPGTFDVGGVGAGEGGDGGSLHLLRHSPYCLEIPR